MRLFLIIPFVYLLTGSLSGQTIISVDSLQKTEKGFYYKGQPFTGILVTYSHACDTRFVFQSSEIKKGMYDGITEFKNSKGEKIGGGLYTAGIKSGAWVEVIARRTECSEPHYIISKGIFEKGIKIGKWEEKGFFGAYKNGKMAGTWTSYHSSTHTKAEQGEYVEGKKEGKWKTWNENGKLLCIQQYVKDSMEGDYIYYKYHSVFLGPKVVGYKQFIDKEGHYSRNLRSGKWTEYGDYKGYKSIGEYIKGKKEGMWIGYFEGKISRKEQYENGKMVKCYTIQKDKDGNKTEKEVLIK